MILSISFIVLVLLGCSSDALPLKDSLAKENGEMMKDFDEGMSEAMNEKIGKDTDGEAKSTDVDATTTEDKAEKDESASKRDEKTVDEEKMERRIVKRKSRKAALKGKKLGTPKSEDTPADANETSGEGSGDGDNDDDDDESDKKDDDEVDVADDQAKYGKVGKGAKSKNWLAEYPIGYPYPIDPIWPPIVYPYPMGWPWGSVPILVSSSSDGKKDKDDGLRKVYRGYRGQVWPARAMRNGAGYAYPYYRTGR